MMDPDEPLLRMYTFMKLKLGEDGKKIIDDLHAVYWDSCVGKTAVYRWISEFLYEKSPSNPVDGCGPPFSSKDE